MHKKYITWGNKKYKVLQKPTRHIVIDALENKPNIAARWNLKSDNPPKACTCDMIHLSPYKNCSIGCTFCSLPRYRGYSLLKYQHGISVVFSNYDTYVNSWLEKCNFLHTVDFGADADVFMDLNRRYHMTEKTMEVLNKWGVPFTATTKGRFTKRAIDALSKNPNSWAQISIITTDETIRKQLVPGADGATINQIAANVEALKSAGVHVTARIQPYISGLSERPFELIKSVSDMGFDSVVFGFMRVPMSAGKVLLEEYSRISGRDFSKLYTEKTPGYWQISDQKALRILEEVKKACNKYGLDLGLCDVYTKNNGVYQSEQPNFGNCKSCETVNAYGYVKNPENNQFERVEGCIGNCFYCNTTPCGFPQFNKSVKYSIKDYSKLIQS